jgi:hypothetical protein
MGIYKGTFVGDDDKPWLSAAVVQTPPDRSKAFHGARLRRVHNAASLKAATATRLIVRDVWEKFTPAQRNAWKYDAPEAACNRDNTTNALRNGWIYFCRANFASAWFVGKADRLVNELPSWSVQDFAITAIVLTPRTFTFGFTSYRSTGDPRQPRLFVYVSKPDRKHPPQSYKNTRCVKVYEGPFADEQVHSLPLVSPWLLIPGDSLTVMTRLATDAGYGPTRYITVEVPSP